MVDKSAAEIIKFETGENIFVEGDESRNMYVIIQGNVEISKEYRGDKQILAEIGPKQVIGEMSFLDGAPRSATATATDEVIAYVLDYEKLNFEIGSLPTWLSPVIMTILERIRRDNVRIHELEEMIKNKRMGKLKKGEGEAEASSEAAPEPEDEESPEGATESSGEEEKE